MMSSGESSSCSSESEVDDAAAVSVSTPEKLKSLSPIVNRL